METSIEGIEFELDMIRYILLLDPKNQELSPDELDQLVNEEFKNSRD